MSSEQHLSTSWALSGDSSKSNKLLKHVVHGVGSASLLVAPVTFAQLPPASGEVDVNTVPGENSFGGRRAQGVAVAPDGDTIVVWTRSARYDYGFSRDVYVRLFDQTGTALTGEIMVAEGSDPSVAVDGSGNFVVGFETPFTADVIEDYGTKPAMRLFDAAGTPTSGVIDVDVNPVDNPYSDDVDVAMSPDGNIAAAWERSGSVSSYGQTIWVRTFNAAGVATSAPVQASADSAEGTFIQEPSVAMDADGDFVTAWETSYDPGDEGYARQVQVRRFNANGTPAAAEQVVTANDSGTSADPDVAMNLAGDFVVSFDQQGVYVAPYGRGRIAKMRIYNADGSPRTGVLDVDASQPQERRQQDLSVAMGENRVAVAWHAERSESDYTQSVFLRTFSTAGVPNGPTQDVNISFDGSNNDPSVGIDPHGDLVAVGWEAYAGSDDDAQDIRLRMFGEIREKTPPAPAVPVPTLDRIGLLLMAGLTGLFAWFGLRRRRSEIL